MDPQNNYQDNPSHDMASEIAAAFKTSYMTFILAGINVLVWIVMEIAGDTNSADFVAEHGGMWPPYVIIYGQWWRLFTSCFIHFGPLHLFNNMLALVVLGMEAERACGHVKFLLIYLISGVAGSSLSLFSMIRTLDFAVAAGASGAIFGIMGTFIVIFIVHKGHYPRFTPRRLIAMIFFSLYIGFVSGGVDNAGHIGGLIGGFAASFLIYGIPYIVSCKRSY